MQPKRTVNRAARIAAQCEPGQVCVGVPMGDGEEPPDPGKYIKILLRIVQPSSSILTLDFSIDFTFLGPSVDVDVLGVKQLKGISIKMAIFACRKRKMKTKHKPHS